MRTLIVAAVLSALLVDLQLIDLQTASSADRRPQYTARRTSAKIEIDGRLDEPAWQKAETFGKFQFPWWTSGEKEQTTARMLWDEEFLYVSYECQDAHISAVQTERDSPVYQDDCVELFTAPNPDRPLDYFNIEMNVNRAILDRHHPDGPGKPQVPKASFVNKLPNWH